MDRSSISNYSHVSIGYKHTYDLIKERDDEDRYLSKFNG